MSAAASAEMIETPPVLNFEEIDYKEIEVEEVSAGPAAGWPLPTHTRPRSPGAACRRAGREPGWPPRAAGVAVPPQAEGAAGAPWVCRDTPPTAVYLRRGLLASPLDAAAAGTGGQRRCGWERRCQLTSANPGAVLGRRGGGVLKRGRFAQDSQVSPPILPPSFSTGGKRRCQTLSQGATVNSDVPFGSLLLYAAATCSTCHRTELPYI